MDKAAFLRQCGQAYGYGMRRTGEQEQEAELEIDALRRDEFAQLEGTTTQHVHAAEYDKNPVVLMQTDAYA